MWKGRKGDEGKEMEGNNKQNEWEKEACLAAVNVDLDAAISLHKLRVGHGRYSEQNIASPVLRQKEPIRISR